MIHFITFYREILDYQIYLLLSETRLFIFITVKNEHLNQCIDFLITVRFVGNRLQTNFERRLMQRRKNKTKIKRRKTGLIDI